MFYRSKITFFAPFFLPFSICQHFWGNWVSSRLQIKFALNEETLEIYRPDGQRFLTTLELSRKFEKANQLAEQERQRAERLLAQLLALGVTPD